MQNMMNMKTQWFRRFGWFYVPVSVPGMVVWLIAALFCLTVFRAVDRHSHSASDTLYGIFPFFVCAFLLLDWIGSRTSDRQHSSEAR
jgi:4-amino-4-deoxy-L-arabinose transferase-like glycosyltransferase